MEKYTIIWTDFAKNEYYQILKYWFEYTQSYEYPERIENEVSIYEKYLKDNPKIGRKIIEDKKIRRIVILSNFSIFYKIINDNIIQIISFFDNRQDPKKLENL